MIVKSLIGEFEQEVQNTRKLLSAIPDDALGYKPSDISWTMGQLASHIAEVYNWYELTFHLDVLDMATYKYDKGDISKTSNILEKFEQNVLAARSALERATDESMFKEWKMVMGGSDPIFPVMPRINVVRGFLFNHLYHHRGEMVVYLRASGNIPPSIYGPTAEESRAMASN
ncbi:MAG: DinB family protein [Ferruginibacter sp.]